MWESGAVNDSGAVILVATPIGNASDASPAVREALATAEVIAAEDTRRLRALLRRLEISSSARAVSYYDANEVVRASELLAELAAGHNVVVVSDAGMPLVSDPGYRLVGEAIAAGYRVRVVPGPSAVLAALAVSGLPTDRFCFEGFLPRKPEQRRRRLAELASEPRTMVFFEAPHRLAEVLAAAASQWGEDRQAVVCRELTKTHEEIVRGTVGELRDWAVAGVRGEITLVVAGASGGATDPDTAVAEVLARVRAGDKLSAVVAEVAAITGLPRKQLYELSLAARGDAR